MELEIQLVVLYAIGTILKWNFASLSFESAAAVDNVTA